jgi:dihydroorotate dehydrogenase electron transfer subunit
MLRALAALPGVTGQFSLESRMGCGFGVCMGCTVATTDGPRRVCADGPVFQKEALQW